MSVAGLAVALVALAVALAALRLALATRQSLAAVVVAQNEQTLASERSIQQLTARCTTIEQQATDGLARLRAELGAQLDAGLAQIQDALAVEVAVQAALLREVEDPPGS